MRTTDEARTPRAEAGSGRWRFLRHYLEMVAAMLVGMMVVGAAVRGALALAGLRFPTRYPELLALEMALDMSVGMVAWMRYRGHDWRSTLEMVAAMIAPAVALVPLLWLDVIAGDALLVLEHLAMFPLMFLVMRYRRASYGGSANG